MLPVGPLMVEHRLIERMIALLGREAKRIRTTGKADTDFVLSGIEFIRLCADHSHHGKEETILFRELKRKPLSPEHRRVLEELEAEHVQGRKTVARLATVRERVLKGEATADVTVAEALSDKNLDALKVALKSVTGKDVALNVNVDPSIIGGLMVKLGSRMIDSSLRTKLNSIKHAMKEAG